MRPTLFLLLMFVPAIVRAQDPVGQLPSIPLPPELERVLRDYEAAWKASDEHALSGLFTEDGFIPRSHGWIRGRDAIRAAYERSGGDLRLRALAYAASDSVGYIIGAYAWGDEAGDAGSFVLTLRRIKDGPWLIAADIDKSHRSE